MGNARDTGYLQNIVTYDANDNIVLPANLNVGGAATFATTVTVLGNLHLQGTVTKNINFYDSSNTNINAQIQYDQISSTSGQLFFRTNNAGTFATRLTISNTGAATFSSSVSATTLSLSATVADYAATITNIQDDSQGLLVRATDNDSGLYLIRAQSSNSSTSQTWVDRFTLAKNGAATFSSSVTAQNGLIVSGSAGTTGFARFTDSVTASMFVGINSGTPYIHSNNSTLSFGANGSNTFAPTMTLSSGNVGIGTASPSANFILDMTSTKASGASGMRLTTQSTSAGPIIVLNYTGSALTNWGIGAHQSTSGSLEFVSSNSVGGDPSTVGTSRMQITSTGNVGIGTGFTPSYPLHVYVGVADWGAVVQNLNASSYGMYVRGGATNGSTSAFYVANTVSSELLNIKGDGKTFFTNTVTAPSFTSLSTSASIPFTTWTTVYNTDAYYGGIYLIQVGLNGASSDDWSASAIYFSGANSDMRYLVGPVNGNLVQLRKTGNSIQVYQNGTSPSITLSIRVLKVS